MIAYYLRLFAINFVSTVAMRRGASLVPVFCFGETELFEQVELKEDSWLRKMQMRFKKALGFTPVLFYGRGTFFVQKKLLFF